MGKISFVFRKQRGKPQKYRIRYDEGTVMECLEKDIERTPEPEDTREDRVSSSVEREEDEQLHVGDRHDEDEDDRQPMEREGEEVEGNTGTVDLDSFEDEAYEEDETVTRERDWRFTTYLLSLQLSRSSCLPQIQLLRTSFS